MSMSPTDAAAWWGAISGTLVLVWDVFKWFQSGPTLEVTVRGGMDPFGNVPPQIAGQTWVIIQVVNKGDQRTTLTHLVAAYYSSWLRRILRRADQNFLINDPRFDRPIPCTLDPGERWLGGMLQTPDVEAKVKNGLVYCGVCHTGSNKAVMARLTSIA